jgi:nucleotide-binding universal stress UspA family protein
MLAIDDLLVARDFSPVSNRAVRYAFGLAARTGATLHVLNAEVLHESLGEDRDRSPAEGFDTFRDELRRQGRVSAEALDAVPIEEVKRRDVAPGPAILNYAAEAEVDLISVGTHGRHGPSRVLLGSVAEEVVRQAKAPVLTVRGAEEESSELEAESIERILVPVDFSDYSREALQTAKEWAALYGATLDALHVVPEKVHPAFYVGGIKSIYDMQPKIKEKVQEQLDEFLSDTGGPSVETRAHVTVGNAAPDIVEFTGEHEIDLVAMSTHGRTGLDRFLIGSVAEKIVRHAECPVLTMKAFGSSIVSPNDASG